MRSSIRPPVDGDVVVVGAGPAGAAAATHLARRGLSVILIDRRQFPRDKVCGDFVGPVALRELHRLGITELPEFRQSNVVPSAAIHLDGTLLMSSPIPSVPGLPSHGRVIPRMVLDRWIVQAARAAGAQVLESHRAQHFEVDGDGVTLTLTEGESSTSRVIRARALVGADGSSSLIARLLHGRPARDEDRIIAVRGYFEGIVGPPDQADLYFAAESFPGYAWLFPTGPAAANVGVGMVRETLPRTSDHLRELLLRLIEEDSGLKARLQGTHLRGKVVGWPLTTYNPRVPIVGERVLLAGDAAGLINPLNGEGIQYALLSGRWAAETLADCATRDDFSRAALRAYALRVQGELRYDMALSRLIVQVIRNRSLNPLWLQVLRIIVARARMDPIYADVASGVMAGVVPASSLMSGKILGSTLRRAAIGTGKGAVKHLAQGPGHLTRIGLDTTRLGLEVVATAAQHPGEFLKWGLGVAACGAELGAQVARHECVPREASRAANERAGGLRITLRQRPASPPRYDIA